MATWGGSDNFGKDSFVMQTNPDTNYGSNSNLVLGADTTGKTALLDYTLAYVDFSAAPVTVDNVTSAYIYMYLHTGLLNANFKGRWHRITETWYEVDAESPPPYGVTWNNQPNNDGTIRSAEVCPAQGWNAWDVWTSGSATSILKDAIANRSKILDTLLIVSSSNPSSVQHATFHSSDYWGGYNPYLIINYTPPAGAAGNRGYVFGSRLGLPDLPRGWLRRPDLRGLALPAGY